MAPWPAWRLSRRWRVGVIGLLLAAAWATPAAGPTPDATPLVIVLSWDGVRHDYPQRGEFPGLSRMARDGARAQRLIAPWPSSTFPAHVTLATGAPTRVHGIVDNQFYDRERGEYRYSAEADWIEAEPLWIAAERQGIRAATYFWVGSETDWRGQRASDRKAPFDENAAEADKVDRIVAWIDRPPASRPGLIMSYWRGTDAVGHNMGPLHPTVFEALRQQDRQLQRLLHALDERDLWRSTTLLVVSDHGMTAISEFFDLAGFLERNGYPARRAGGATVTHIFLDEPEQAGALAAALTAKPRIRAWPAAELPAAITLQHPLRNGDVIAIADPPLILQQPAWSTRLYFHVMNLIDGRVPATHGYDPAHPDMAGIFFALGRGVPPGGDLGILDMTDLAPTVAALLGIEPPRDATGRALLGP